MKNYNSTKTSPNAQSSNERAQSANAFAKQARGFRDIRNTLAIELKEWERIMVDSPVVLLTIAFFILAVVEIIISWKMYGEMQASILSVPNPFLSTFMGLMVVSLGAVVSHYVAKRLSGSLFELEVFNMMHKNNNAMPRVVAEEKVRIKTRKHFQIGLILFLILVIGVLAISFQRVGMMGAITGKSFGLLQKLLPVIIVTLEVFCGIYLGYLFRKIWKNRKIKKQHEQFEKTKDACAYETRMCKECYDHAVQRDEQLSYNRELRDTMFRFEHRSQDNDNYVNEIQEAKNIKVLVTNEGKPLQGIHLFGLLPGREFTNGIYTNDTGQAVLEWMNDENYLEGVMVNNFPFKGPFRNNTNIKIDLDQDNQKVLKAEG
jgi:hypothetical protein